MKPTTLKTTIGYSVALIIVTQGLVIGGVFSPDWDIVVGIQAIGSVSILTVCLFIAIDVVKHTPKQA